MTPKIFRLPIIAAAAFAGASVLASSPALAAIMVTYDYSATASADSNSGSLNDFPATGVERVNGPPDIDTQVPRSFSSLVGAGSDSPINFTTGVASAGNASASSDLRVRVAITNDTGSRATFDWNAVIFAGGVGYATPNFTSAGCGIAAIENCDSFGSFTGARDGYNASMQFQALLDNNELFSGDIRVNEDVSTASFNNIALDGFGLEANNSSFYQWEETNYTQSLGEFANGETKILEFLVSASVASSNFLDCSPNSFENCYISLAGFGDPPGGSDGGVGMGPQSFFVSFALTSNPVPVPPAALLFVTGAAAFAARRRKKKAE